MPTINHPDFIRPVTYTVTPLPEYSADAQVSATIAVMRRYALEDSRNPDIVSLALALACQANTPQELACLVFDAVKQRMRFQRDEQTGAVVDDNAVEVLVRPVDVIALSNMGQAVPGDCDCFSMFVASLLLAAGVDCSFVTISGDANASDQFSHVYVVAWPQSQYRMVVDASHGPVAGWEAPNCGRYQEWPVTATGSRFGSLFVLAALVAGFFLFNKNRSTKMYGMEESLA